MGIAQTDAQKLLYEGEFSHAIPAALQALRCSMTMFGKNALELVPCYLLLGEASIGKLQDHYFEDRSGLFVCIIILFLKIGILKA